MKKKIIALCLIVVLAITAITGATLAYFTDTDKADNVFAVGNVAISLIEQQRKEKDGEKTTELEGFEQNQKLYPIVGSAQNNLDELGLPTAENYVDKIVTIKNTGSEKAWIRAYFAIPSALDNGYEDFNAGLNTLHFNYGNKLSADGKVEHTTFGNEWKWQKEDGKFKYFETTMDGIKYNVYMADYYEPVAGGATTEQLIIGVYLDKSFDYADGKYYAFGTELVLDNGWNWNSVKCPVFAVAVQEAGFDSAEAAVTGAFGDQYNPWKTAVTNWQ